MPESDIYPSCFLSSSDLTKWIKKYVTSHQQQEALISNPKERHMELDKK